jgi:hypothetical protein
VKKFVFIAVLQFLFCSALLAQTVYVTKTGKKYHTSNCSSLRSSSIPITLSEANQKGYGPCSRCDPPIYSETNNQDNKSNLLDDSKLREKLSSTSTTSSQCIAITKKGTQCSRNAQEGSDFCWQHNKNSSTIKSETKSNNSNPTGRTIYTGPRGGKYYINKNGNKTYIKKK